MDDNTAVALTIIGIVFCIALAYSANSLAWSYAVSSCAEAGGNWTNHNALSECTLP